MKNLMSVDNWSALREWTRELGRRIKAKNAGVIAPLPSFAAYSAKMNALQIALTDGDWQRVQMVVRAIDPTLVAGEPATVADVKALLEAQQGKERAPPASKWLTTQQVADRYEMHKTTVEKLVADAEAKGIKPVPWMQAGSGTRRRHLRWDSARTEDFMVKKEIRKWRSSNRAVANSSSGGAISRAGRAVEPARRGKLQVRSSSPSRPPTASGATGNLKSLVSKLTSSKR